MQHIINVYSRAGNMAGYQNPFITEHRAPRNKIFNERTGRWVLEDGCTGLLVRYNTLATPRGGVRIPQMEQITPSTPRARSVQGIISPRSPHTVPRVPEPLITNHAHERERQRIVQNAHRFVQDYRTNTKGMTSGSKLVPKR